LIVVEATGRGGGAGFGFGLFDHGGGKGKRRMLLPATTARSSGSRVVSGAATIAPPAAACPASGPGDADRPTRYFDPATGDPSCVFSSVSSQMDRSDW